MTPLSTVSGCLLGSRAALWPGFSGTVLGTCSKCRFPGPRLTGWACRGAAVFQMCTGVGAHCSWGRGTPEEARLGPAGTGESAESSVGRDLAGKPSSATVPGARRGGRGWRALSWGRGRPEPGSWGTEGSSWGRLGGQGPGVLPSPTGVWKRWAPRAARPRVSAALRF